MSDRATLLSLADEVERLTGPDLEMDARIARMLGWRWETIPAILHTSVWRPDGTEANVSDIPRPTGSIDSAASLMPEGWGWKVEFVGPLFVMSAYHATLIGPRVEARTEALARAAAGLRARAAALRAMAGGDDDR